MTREQAIGIAKANHAAFEEATIQHLFSNGPEPDPADYGSRRGDWFTVAGHTFGIEELTGHPVPCPVQARFAYL